MNQDFANSLVSSVGVTTLLGSILLIAAVVFMTINLVIPTAKCYVRSKTLDKMCGTHEKHWFYGHMIDSTKANRLLSVYEQTKQFPKMYNKWLGPVLSEVLVYHPDTILSVLASGAPKTDISRQFMKPWIGDGLLMSSGKKWQRNRRLLTPAFHYSILRPYTKIFNHSVNVMLYKWKCKVGTPVEVSEDVSLMALDSMLQCAMSSKTDCQNVKGKHPYIAAIYDLARLTSRRFEKPLYLIDFLFYRTKDGKEFTNATNVVHQHAEEIIRQRKQALLEDAAANKNPNKPDTQGFKHRGTNLLDFLDILLQTKDEDGVGLSDREIRDEVDTFLFEGHDTTASGISWALHNLAKHPDFQDRCRKEIIEVVGDKEDIEWEDLSKLSYLTMFIKESMRIHPPVPVIVRQHKKPLHLTHNYSPEKILPNGSLTTVHIFSAHRNENVWDNPMKFDPERFTKENSAKRSPHAYVPFSAGSRNCIGQNFAMNEIKVVLSQVLRKYKLYLDEETPQPMLETLLILKSRNGIWIKLKPNDKL